MLRTFSGRRCDAGSVSGSASAASRSRPPASTTSAANTQCHEAFSSTAAPSEGATTGATPSTSISRDSTVAAAESAIQVTDDGDRHHHRRGGAHALQPARQPEHRDVRREQAQHRRQHVQHDAGHQRPAAAQRVRQRADDQLAERQPGQRAGQRQLRHRRRHRQVVGDPRQRGQIHVDGERAQRDQSAKHHDHADAAGRLRLALLRRFRCLSRPRRSMLPWKWLAPHIAIFSSLRHRQ